MPSSSAKAKRWGGVRQGSDREYAYGILMMGGLWEGVPSWTYMVRGPPWRGGECGRHEGSMAVRHKVVCNEKVLVTF